MKTPTKEKALELLNAIHQCTEFRDMDLHAVEVHKDEWRIYYNGHHIGGPMPTTAIPYALHTLWRFVANSNDNLNK